MHVLSCSHFPVIVWHMSYIVLDIPIVLQVNFYEDSHLRTSLKQDHHLADGKVSSPVCNLKLNTDEQCQMQWK